MAARTTMASIISRVRNMIGDTLAADAGQQFTDDAIQDVLDESRLVVRYAVLRAEPTLGAGGVLSYNDYYSDMEDWEDSPVTILQGPNFTTLTPATTDTLTGHWTFTLPAPGQLRPVYVIGLTYDRYAAAGELLMRWAAATAGQYNVTLAGQSLARSQAATMRMQLASKFRQKARPVIAQIDQTDTAGSQTWPLGNISANDW